MGELIVLRDGHAAVLRRKERALLAYLSITARPHRRAVLAELLCHEADDPAAALRLLLSRLRRCLGPNLLRQAGQQVALNMEACWIDLERFELLLGAGIAACPYDDLAAAVALYRGPLLDGVALAAVAEFDLWLIGARAQLQHQYVEVLQRLIMLVEATDTQAAIGYALALVQAAPLLEEAHGCLAYLYARTGQREAALAQLANGHELIRRELGVEPSSAWQALSEAIEMGTPLPALWPGSSLLAPTPTTPLPRLLERDAELACLGRLWQATAAGNGAMVLIKGQVGAGKSRLLHEFIGNLAAASVRLGDCAELAQALPYAPWVELLETYLDPDDLAALPPHQRGELLRLLPRLALQLGLDPPPAPPTSGPEQEHVFAAAAEVLLPAGTEPIAIAIEDLHAADATSLQFFAYLAGRVSDRPLLLIGTLRSCEAEHLPAVSQQLDALDRLATAQLALQPLSRRAMAELTAQLWVGLPAAQRQVVASVVMLATGGNPLFATELLRELAARGTLSYQLPVPARVRELIGRRLARLPACERQVLDILALLGQPAGFDEICVLGGRSAAETDSALEAGLRIGLLSLNGARPAVVLYRYSHYLARKAVVAQLSPARRQVLHQRIIQHLYNRLPCPPAHTRG
jgi:DNA-binding SARP family transcriptional activator